MLKYKWEIIVFIFTLMHQSSCVELDLIDCGVDHEIEVSVGNVPIKQYPFIGILYYTYHGEIGESRGVTTVALIQKEFVIANAADIGPVSKTNFRKKSRVLLGEHWSSVGRRVRNYVLHPEYGETYNTVALVQLKDPVRLAAIKPLCPPPVTLRNPVFYVMKFNESYQHLQKQVIPVAHIPSTMCKEFYMKANLYNKKMRPPHVACAVALDEDNPCVWDAGAMLVSRDVWGRWMLLGVGARGPGCGAPARFLDMSSYIPWVKYSLGRFERITISKISKQKYVIRSGGRTTEEEEMHTFQRYGACDPEEKTNLIFRELILLKTDNMQYQFLTYNMSILESIEYNCLTLELVNASATAEMRIMHQCDRDFAGPPCYRYTKYRNIFSHDCQVQVANRVLCRMSKKGSSIQIIYTMHAWGHRKDLTLLDIQEWKWEEGAYYEDFSTARHDYRGQKYMTEFGFEPLEQKMWYPEYDLWTTTESVVSTDTPPSTTTTTPTTTPPPPTKPTYRKKTTTLSTPSTSPYITTNP